MSQNKIFVPCRGLGYVSNHIPLQVRYIKNRKENLIVTCVGKLFHTYGISHFGLLSVSGLHSEGITCMSADSFHVYTACGSNIYAWRRGTELKHIYKGHKKTVHLLLPFGIHLISVDEDNEMKVWNIKDESLFLELKFDYKSFNISAILHPNTYINKILLGSEQGELQLWNVNLSKLIYTFKGWKSGVSCLEQAPALDVVAIGLNNGKIIVHNLKFDETVMEFNQDWGFVTSISFRSDGSPIMATGSLSGHIVFWDLEKRRVASQLMNAHDGAVSGMTCLPNEPLILTSSPDNTLKLWVFDLPDGGARLLRIREGHASTPSHIRFHGTNGHNILSASSDSTLRIFNTQTEQFNKSLGKASYNRKASKKRGRGVEDPLKMPPITRFASETTREKEWDNIAAIHLGLPMVTTWSYDKVKMGDLKLLPEKFYKKNNREFLDVCATCLHLTRCGNFVVVGYNTGHVERFNMQSGAWRDGYGSPKAHETAVRGVATDSLNQITITGGRDCQIKFWRFKNKGSTHLSQLEVEEDINFFRIHNESSMLAVALEDFSIDIVDIDTRRIVRKFSGHNGQITDLTFSPDSRWLISSSMDRSVRTWEIPSGLLINQFATETACVSLDLSPTGEALATAHVDYLGIFLWTNKTLYTKVTLKAIEPSDEPQIVKLPECVRDIENVEQDIVDEDQTEFISPEQIGNELITLSGLSTSRWQNLLDINTIRNRNKPKGPIKVPKAAPFFLPTIPSLNFQFDLSNSNETDANSKILMPANFVNLTEFGKMLKNTIDSEEFTSVIEKLKSLGPSMIDFEIKSLSPEGGGTVPIMLQFLKCVEHMLKSNKNFELAVAYLGVFLKSHGAVIAAEEDLRSYLANIQSCHVVAWNKLQDKCFYCLCVIQNLKIK